MEFHKSYYSSPFSIDLSHLQANFSNSDSYNNRDIACYIFC